MGKMVALIAVKGQSDRVPTKNIRPFADTSLLELKLSQIKQVASIDEIVVSSEDEKVLDLARPFEVTLHHRDPIHSKSSSPMSKVYSYLATEVAESGDHIVWIPVTNPLAEAPIYEEAIQFFKKMDTQTYDSLISVHEVKDYIIYKGKPLNFQPNPWPRSQDLKDTYEINFAVNILPRDKMVEWGSLHGVNPYYYPVPEESAMDIDFPIDFEICEYIYKKNKGLK
ncbi:MAG TPA: hypothetical protein DCL41_09705 [Bdellovibrionales bacterium]|nr:hypothetical protein [Pseudobdellovibrionaceae bacterium]HAG92137.1 hypothetical protein [Bdellovibrionales bacterium]